MRWRAAAGGMAPALSAGWNISNVGAVADELSSSYGVSLAVIGLFTTALFVTHAALQVPAGRLCDRLGARLVGVVGLVVTAAASFLALTWHEAAFAISMRTLAGVGTGLSFVAGSDYVRSTIGTPVAQGVYGATSMAGGGLALALVPLFAGWRAPFASAAFIAGGSAVLLAAAPRRGCADRGRRRPPHVRRSTAATTSGHAQRVVRLLGRDRQLGRHPARTGRGLLGGGRRRRRCAHAAARHRHPPARRPRHRPHGDHRRQLRRRRSRARRCSPSSSRSVS